MCFPIMNKQPRRSVNIPDLAGGVNYRDGITEVHDNQLTECKNMWFKDGVLKTRERGIYLELGEFSFEAPLVKRWKDINFGGNKMLYTVSEGSKTANRNRIELFLTDGSGNFTKLPTLEASPLDSFLLIQFKNSLYCYASIGAVFCLESIQAKEWKTLSAYDFYTPRTHIDCMMWGTMTEINGERRLKNPSFEGVGFEGPNLLGSAYKMIYSTVNPERSDAQNAEVSMEYLFDTPLDVAKLVESGNTIVKAKITHIDGKVVEHQADIQSQLENNGKTEDGLYLLVKTQGIEFVKPTTDGSVPEIGNSSSYKIAITTESEYIRNNLEITIPRTYTYDEQKKVFAMTQTEWFGGASEGINGGTRLFLGGNMEEGEQSLMVWSGLNQPLYFPENAYAYVGNTTSAVTGFGKQSDMLVIFKENEIYFTQYQQNTNITADDLINQSVIDYASSKVYFPLTLINANIGCDIPDTIELCRNRLVWANSNGKVYTLTANNQYSERNVYEVGEMVERKLKQLNLKHASACDFAGYYVLFAEGKAYLMDYNSNGYQYVYSYNKNDDAQKNIPWYEWEFSVTENSSISTDGVRLYVLDISDTDDGKKVFFYEVSENAEEGFEENEFVEPAFTSSLTTKAFDFGAAGYRKNVDVVKLFLGNNGGAPIKVEFVTDCGTVSEEIILDSPETENYTAGYITPIHLAPSIRSIIRMALKISSEGKLAVDGAELTYRILGGAR